jgi:DNA-binding LacI/PurR family transcriptional regulator
MTRPQVTTVDQQIERTARAAADWLIGALGRPLSRTPPMQLIEPHLVVRDSTGPAPRRQGRR